MRRSIKSMQGVTLLEIMLVLAIAAMVIVMSIRYYQSASSNQQANTVLQQIQAMTAAADGLAQATGSYNITDISTLTPVLPPNSTKSPWGGDITAAGTGSTYTVTFKAMPAAVCTLVKSKLSANAKYTSMATCNATGTTDFNYTYDSTK